jgi:hypothetical protein
MAENLNTLRAVKPTVVVHPATHHRIGQPRQVLQTLIVRVDAIRQSRMVWRMALTVFMNQRLAVLAFIKNRLSRAHSWHNQFHRVARHRRTIGEAETLLYRLVKILRMVEQVKATATTLTNDGAEPQESS